MSWTRAIERSLGLRLARWQKLYSSFAYLRRLIKLREVSASGLSVRLRVLRRLPRPVGAAQWLFYIGARMLDRFLRTQLALYGWAFYFDRSGGVPMEDRGYLNVCMHCGAGHHSLSLARAVPPHLPLLYLRSRQSLHAALSAHDLRK